MFFKNGIIRVLHSDYDPIVLEKSKIFLEEEGMIVNTFLNIKEALHELKIRKYDIFICDYYELEVNGINLLKELKKRKIEIPFIAFSGKDCNEECLISRVRELEVQIRSIVKQG
ncbi:MAG: hypothetical protein MCSN_3930 [Candidatus Microsyncoccus archaeolyticus]|nr:MAG: hypothetical protein MCSN_3930 [Candidatus Parcubacteria bacterium]